MSNAQRYRNRMAEAREQEQMRDEYHAMEERLSNLEDEYAKLWQMYGDLEDDRDRLREALEKIRHHAELTAPDMQLNALISISEIVDSALQEDGDER